MIRLSNMCIRYRVKKDPQPRVNPTCCKHIRVTLAFKSLETCPKLKGLQFGVG